MTFAEAYEKYHLPPHLILHQLRVAALVYLITHDSVFTPDVESGDRITAAGLHDMGAMVKFDLDYFPDLWQPQGTAYWQSVQSDVVQRYGSDEHLATPRIISELGVSQRAAYLAGWVGFAKASQNLHSADPGRQIVAYADSCISPDGYVGLKTRIHGDRKRHKANHGPKAGSDRKFALRASALQLMERQIQTRAPALRLEHITPSLVDLIAQELKDFSINSAHAI
ncbi:hypothetical protein A2899_04365 [Candidatus Amesbacteria bacterium RIFCSPLOWO2_01_FULL_49_25]|uniref:HD domain-containing protein n=1 Tax=Candidatus Amesbacteria bacterium RIFCSPHIGHO2_01_FULL_48_32b TaxID=1797253 RepID=A0A1F4YG82_9BACT|nr:MAG: hypothetical protein A2876_00470 [Candidatus Amesbacteria bacterium RIFCSPHIGHO2_01_FULL_48_32b]OGD07507.1 MAG: hypothetical protein A2899_04365 [Candidatus Amesbacteria bacterium RIFCSPLOWO2_01_FULL_49_25]